MRERFHFQVAWVRPMYCQVTVDWQQQSIDVAFVEREDGQLVIAPLEEWTLLDD
jgi:hypothetical protein